MTAMLLDAEELVARWRAGAEDNPAGPVFANGEFAEGDIVACNPPGSRCSSCTASRPVYCC
ncbi:DUF6229 family protein [Actinosynnema sp. NPDC020468]|uniref:DUF6229 family protein n=1 Tax=Actinosynnema sp. NPDC020468 TaxID=3154488 RepID=UPI0033D64A3E